MPYEFYAACTDCYEPSKHALLNAMLHDETVVDVSRQTFMKHCRDSAREVFMNLGYASHPKRGLTAAGDYHISYHRSKWNGKRCYFFCWSAIEHIFVS